MALDSSRNRDAQEQGREQEHTETEWNAHVPEAAKQRHKKKRHDDEVIPLIRWQKTENECDLKKRPCPMRFPEIPILFIEARGIDHQ